jgi:hypothetical protein
VGIELDVTDGELIQPSFLIAEPFDKPHGLVGRLLARRANDANRERKPSAQLDQRDGVRGPRDTRPTGDARRATSDCSTEQYGA